MKNNNAKKDALLGESHGTAGNRLRKLLLFSLVQETGRNVCFQCGEQILSADELSIEHKEPWMSAENPREAFFDLNNIAFSHLSCNVAAANRPNKTEHGTINAYRRGCRCNLCKTAQQKTYQNDRTTRLARPRS
jgi:hypothetical protein